MAESCYIELVGRAAVACSCRAPGFVVTDCAAVCASAATARRIGSGTTLPVPSLAGSRGVGVAEVIGSSAKAVIRAARIQWAVLRAGCSILSTFDRCVTVADANTGAAFVRAISTNTGLQFLVSKLSLPASQRPYLTLLQQAPLVHGVPGAQVPVGSPFPLVCLLFSVVSYVVPIMQGLDERVGRDSGHIMEFGCRVRMGGKACW
jgi:hypothetical protein